MKCIFCFNETGKVYFDKKDRPYFYCNLCSHRIFFRSPIGLKSILVWAETAKALSQAEYIALLEKVENSLIYQHKDVKKWVKDKITESDVVSNPRGE